MNDRETLDWRRLLTAADRAAMFSDILSVSLAAGTELFPDQPWSDIAVSAGPDLAAKSPIEQLSYLESLLPILTQAFAQISRSSLTGAVTAAQLVAPPRARRVSAAAWMRCARQGQSSRSVEETIAAPTLDVRENQAIKSFVALLHCDSCRIEKIAEAEQETEAALRAQACAQQLRRLMPECWRNDVSSDKNAWKGPATHREMLRPDYAQVLRARQEYRKRFCFDWDHTLLKLPPRETWQVYEIWCLFVVLRTLRELGWALTPRQEVFAVREGRLALTLAKGNQSRIVLQSPQGEPLTLAYNQTFAEGSGSLSHTMQPDIVISDETKLWILDAKFKAYTEPGEEGGDINQMHAYRDAIIGKGEGRNVVHAWCLYPGLAQTHNRSHIAYGRHTEAAVGALCLRPASPGTQGAGTLSDLKILLKQWLTSGTEKPAPLPFPET